MTAIHDTIAELRRLLAAATPGPWHASENKSFTDIRCEDGFIGDTCGSLFRGDSAPDNMPLSRANAEAITFSHNALPAILDHLEAVEAITAERDQLRAERDAANAHAADLRRALEELCSAVQLQPHAALARTPAQSLASLEARVLREVWKKVCAKAVVVEEKDSRTYSWSDAAVVISDEATSREEAANGPE